MHLKTRSIRSKLNQRPQIQQPYKHANLRKNDKFIGFVLRAFTRLLAEENKNYKLCKNEEEELPTALVSAKHLDHHEEELSVEAYRYE